MKNSIKKSIFLLFFVLLGTFNTQQTYGWKSKLFQPINFLIKIINQPKLQQAAFIYASHMGIDTTTEKAIENLTIKITKIDNQENNRIRGFVSKNTAEIHINEDITADLELTKGVICHEVAHYANQGFDLIPLFPDTCLNGKKCPKGEKIYFPECAYCLKKGLVWFRREYLAEKKCVETFFKLQDFKSIKKRVKDKINTQDSPYTFGTLDTIIILALNNPKNLELRELANLILKNHKYPARYTYPNIDIDTLIVKRYKKYKSFIYKKEKTEKEERNKLFAKNVTLFQKKKMKLSKNDDSDI
ncbi:hypothetical protein KAH94_05115 [bacterium]|nr:hypothetical protein [bacterium]